MITITNTATLTTCDVWRENTIRKHDQRCSVCRNSIITSCKSVHSIFQTRKTHAAFYKY